MHRYRIWNYAMPTTAAPVPVATGTAIKTMLQLATPSTRQLTVLAWGFSVDDTEFGQVELIQTDVGATVTAHVASGVQPVDPNAPPSLLTLGTAATGYTATAEGAITTTRTFDDKLTDAALSAQTNFEKVFTPAERPIIAVSRFLRIRAKFITTVNMLCWVLVDE